MRRLNNIDIKNSEKSNLESPMTNLIEITGELIVNTAYFLNSFMSQATIIMIKNFTELINSLKSIDENNPYKENIIKLIDSQNNIINYLADASKHLSELLSKLITKLTSQLNTENILHLFTEFLNYIKSVIGKIIEIAKGLLNIDFLDNIAKFINTFVNSFNETIKKLTSFRNANPADIIRLISDQDFVAFMSFIAPIAKAIGQSLRLMNLSNVNKISTNTTS